MLQPVGAQAGDHQVVDREDGENSVLANLVDSMPRRLQDVIEKDGEFTKYQIVLNYTVNLINFNFSIFSHFCKFERRFFVRPAKIVADCNIQRNSLITYNNLIKA